MTLKELGYKLTEKDGKYYYNGDINLDGEDITILPDNLVVGGNISLRWSNITSIPDNLVVRGSLDLKNTEITTLPDNLMVGGSISLRNIKITSLPDNLVVGGNLYLGGTKITSLPDNLIVGRSLYIQGTKISSLPDNLIVGRRIFYDDTRIKKEVNKVNHNVPKILFWGNKEYAKVNDDFFKILSNCDSIYKIIKIGENKILSYLITNGNCSKFAINNTLEIAKKEYNLLNIKK